MWRRSFPIRKGAQAPSRAGTAQLCDVTSGGDDETELELDPEVDDVPFDEDAVDGVAELCVLVVPPVPVVVVCDTAATPPEPSTGSWPSRIWR
jgi:hypothetical protein